MAAGGAGAYPADSARLRGAAIVALAALAVLLAFAPAGSAELTAREVLQRTLAAQDQVEDYSARCTLAVTLPDQELPERRFTVYFKRPDKVKIVSQEIVFVPREALTLGSLRRHLTENTEVSLAGVGTIGEYPLYCLKLKPKGDNQPGRVLVWIRGDYFLPTKTEIWQGQTRLVQIQWTFGWIAEKYWMPTRIYAYIPSGIINDQGPATLALTWQDYRVNQGLTDEFFQE
jgi:outer membrane lipoprotein-sorting protein